MFLKIKFCHFFNQKGILVASHSCGVVLGYEELIRSESNKSVIDLLKKIFMTTDHNYNYCLYDNACHLDETIKSNSDQHTILNAISFFIDRFHLKNHVRKCCQTTYNPYLEKALEKLNSQACEQKFSVVNKHKYAVKHMTQYHFIFYFFCIFDSLNHKIIENIKSEKKTSN